MKYISIDKNETLSSLSNKVGHGLVDQVIADNGLKRTPNIGQQWYDKCEDAKSNTKEVVATEKIAILNKYIQNSDIYEKAALSSESEWKCLSTLNSFSDYLYISDQLEDQIPDSYDVIGNKISVAASIYEKINEDLLHNNYIDSSLFSIYSSISNKSVSKPYTETNSNNPLGWFKIPNGEVMLFSSIDNGSIIIPAYPEEIDDSRSATYTTMPDLLFQYEPWQMYQSSGPRSNTYKFHLHRDMWSGNHLDGKANELIRFCQAQLYPKYNGASVTSPTVALYISGQNEITGILTNVDVGWSGPLGQDGYYLELNLSLTITEVSPTPLNYNTILQKPLIG